MREGRERGRDADGNEDGGGRRKGRRELRTRERNERGRGRDDRVARRVDVTDWRSDGRIREVWWWGEPEW